MSGRDLLYEPQVPSVLHEAQSKSSVEEVGVEGPRGRDLGGAPGDAPVRAPVPRRQRGEPARAPVFEAAYFNQDVSGVGDVNQRASNMQALRGAEGASDLRRVVLPPAIGVDNPEPARLRGAGDLMGLDGSFDLGLESIVGRQGAWARGRGVTPEMLEQRMAQLQQMIAARRAAIDRLLARGVRAASATVEQAVRAQGRGVEAADDIVEEGRALIGRTAEQAEGMHRRLAKVLGVERS